MRSAAEAQANFATFEIELNAVAAPTRSPYLGGIRQRRQAPDKWLCRSSRRSPPPHSLARSLTGARTTGEP